VMTLKFKLIIGVVIICILVCGGYYVWSRGASARELDKKLEEAKATVQQLMGERDSLETIWQTKEKDYEDQINSLNDRLKKKQKEVSILETRIAQYKKEREAITVPDSVDGIVTEFRKSGIKSATVSPKPKPR